MNDELPVQDIFDAVQSFVLTTGFCDSVNTSEPLNPPGTGVICGIWVNKIGPTESSGLDKVSIRLELNVRLYTSLITIPSDIIDPNMLKACSGLMNAFVNDFDLTGLARQIDIFGNYGPGMDAQAGYLAQQGGVVNRVMTITLPIIVDDVWVEA